MVATCGLKESLMTKAIPPPFAPASQLSRNLAPVRQAIAITDHGRRTGADCPGKGVHSSGAV